MVPCCRKLDFRVSLSIIKQVQVLYDYWELYTAYIQKLLLCLRSHMSILTLAVVNA